MENDQIIMYGANWCPDCRRSKQFFGEHRIDYVWVDVQQDAEAAREVERINKGSRTIPTIVFPDGDVMVEPTNAELARKLNLQTKASRSYYDVVVIGAGPAGLTAATYTTREGLDTLVIDKGSPGGQVGVSQVLDNFPGFPEGVTGADLARRLVAQAVRFGAEILSATAVDRVERSGNYLCITTEGGDEYSAKVVLIASGSSYRRLNVPGEDELIGANVHFCATCDGAFYRDKDVMVIGGGNSGFEEGLYLTRFANQVTILDRNPEPKASPILQDKVSSRDNMSVIANRSIKEFKRTKDNKLESVVVEDKSTGKTEHWYPDGVFVFIGLSPSVGFELPDVERDQFGFIKTDSDLMSSVEGIFAAGDVRAGSTKQAASAAGEGATVALMIRQYLQEMGDAPHYSSLEAAI